MGPPATKPQTERDATDESLRLERSKTDDELNAPRTPVEEGADQVVEVARERAEALLREKRAQTDRGLTREHAAAAVHRGLASERAHEDRALAEEQAVADEQLRVERLERKRALVSLLALEREETDERLLVERARADETVEARDDFLGMVSHDLRTLLGGIALNAAALEKQASTQGSAGATAVRRAESIKRLTARMNRLVGDLLDVVSLEAGKLAISPAPYDAVEVVREALSAFELSFAAKGLTLTSRSESASLAATFDQERILQVLANVLSNALKFTESGGHVEIAVAQEGAKLCFSVTDTGIGIPAGEEEAIFERFRQVTAKDRRGLGLGLYIAKCIVEAHGGTIWAARRESGGTALHFTLPCGAG